MTKQDFLDQFELQFIAAWSARNYQKCVDNADFSLLLDPPVSHARLLARNAWKRLGKVETSANVFDSLFGKSIFS